MTGLLSLLLSVVSRDVIFRSPLLATHPLFLMAILFDFYCSLVDQVWHWRVHEGVHCCEVRTHVCKWRDASLIKVLDRAV